MTMSPSHFCARLTTSGHLPQLCQRTDRPLVSFIGTLSSLSLNCRDLDLEIPIDQTNVPQSKMHTSLHPTPINCFLDTLMPPTQCKSTSDTTQKRALMLPRSLAPGVDINENSRILHPRPTLRKHPGPHFTPRHSPLRHRG